MYLHHIFYIASLFNSQKKNKKVHLSKSKTNLDGTIITLKKEKLNLLKGLNTFLEKIEKTEKNLQVSFRHEKIILSEYVSKEMISKINNKINKQ